MESLPISPKRHDIFLLIATLILVVIGTVMVYSSSAIMAMDRFHDGQYFLKRQIFFVVLGLGVMFFLLRVPYQTLRPFAYPAVIVSFVLLLLLFVPVLGKKVGGAVRWLNLGFIAFQVGEWVKFSVVLFLAFFMSRKRHYVKEFFRGIAVPLGIAACLMGLIILQPDFGTTAIIAVTTMIMLYLGGARVLHLTSLAALFAPFAVWALCHGYRWERLMTFLNPWSDPRGAGFQVIQSMISFGSGGIFGVGVGDGMQKLYYLPEPHTDFILAVIAEEGGFIGVSIVMGLYTLFIIRGFMISFRAPDLFGMLLAAGLTLLFALQIFINSAGVMGLIPLKGLTLPFLSYGGSSLLMSFSMVGILLSISSQEKTS
ncbi:MAG: putative lipid II flippase FtsW [Syntrophobacterales bacterium]|jgi:cell division protein FtsW|nr:putative lipid II flippase FtsW [Syntrophobacterales bacterium]